MYIVSDSSDEAQRGYAYLWNDGEAGFDDEWRSFLCADASAIAYVPNSSVCTNNQN
jgi:hypothetical protein